MGKLEEILRKLKNVDYVNRPLEQEEATLPPQEEEAMGGFPTKPPVDPQSIPLKPDALGSMQDIMNMGTKGDETPLPEPDAQAESPIRKKMRYLDMMNQTQKMRPNPIKPMNTLAGGSGGTGIF